jgi:hypothetical protein
MPGLKLRLLRFELSRAGFNFCFARTYIIACIILALLALSQSLTPLCQIHAERDMEVVRGMQRPWSPSATVPST